MLDGLLGRGFSSKCKSLIKLTRTRLDAITRKRNAMQKYLKKDIADLLANGLDINAYGRAEGLSTELNLSSCYDSVEQFCESIPKHLSAMQKQRECPEECREAVSSLMFAAARFANLPELRDLRDTFTERYEKTLESFVNKEFVENLASKPPTTKKKLRLMEEIALEFSIKWDSKAFEQKIVNSDSPAQNLPKRQGSINGSKMDGNRQYISQDDTAPKRDNQDASSTGRRGLPDDGYVRHGNRNETSLGRDNLHVPSNGRGGSSNEGYRLRSEGEQTISEKGHEGVLSHRRLELSDDKYEQHKGSEKSILEKGNDYPDDRFKPHKGRDHTTRKRENHDLFSPQEYPDDGFKPHKGRDDTIPKRDNSYHGRRKQDNGHELHIRADNIVPQRDQQEISSCREEDYPKIKQKMKMNSKEDILFAGNDHKAPHKSYNLVAKASNGAEGTNSYNLIEKASKGAEGMKPLPPPPYLRPIGGKYTSRHTPSHQANKAPADFLANDRSERAQTGLDSVDYDERRVVGPARENGHDNVDHQDDLVGDRKPKPKSVRRRNMKPSASQDYGDSNEGDEIIKKHPNGRRREDTRQGLQHPLENDRYSKDKEERMMDKLLMHYSKKPSQFEPINVREGLNASPGLHDVADAGEHQRRLRKDAARLGLGLEPVPPPSRANSLPPEPVTPTETRRVPARATSFQPEMVNPGGHVHPRLPDYDDLAARFAALRGG